MLWSKEFELAFHACLQHLPSIAPNICSSRTLYQACCLLLKPALFLVQAEVDAAIAKLKELKVDAAAKQEVSCTAPS